MPGIKLRRVSVRSFLTTALEVYWEVEPTHRDLFDFTFQVLYSESPDGPFDAISPELEDEYRFVDDRIHDGHRLRRHFYKIRIREKPTDLSRDDGPYESVPVTDLIALEMRRHRELLYREFSGRRSWILPKRTFGQRCGCFNQDLQKQTRSGCLTCFDTGFVRGYLRPIETFLQFEPLAESTPAPTRTRVEVPAFPQVKPGDVVIEPENARWRVLATTGPEHVRAQVFQSLDVHRIDPSDTEYKIPFHPGRDVHHVGETPERNLTSPQSLGPVLSDASMLSLYSRGWRRQSE